MIPWENLQIDKLRLMDAKGEEILSISFDFNRKKANQELNFL